jgi:hypothetical protein
LTSSTSSSFFATALVGGDLRTKTSTIREQLTLQRADLHALVLNRPPRCRWWAPIRVSACVRKNLANVERARRNPLSAASKFGKPPRAPSEQEERIKRSPFRRDVDALLLPRRLRIPWTGFCGVWPLQDIRQNADTGQRQHRPAWKESTSVACTPKSCRTGRAIARSARWR